MVIVGGPRARLASPSTIRVRLSSRDAPVNTDVAGSRIRRLGKVASSQYSWWPPGKGVRHVSGLVPYAFLLPAAQETNGPRRSQRAAPRPSCGEGRQVLLSQENHELRFVPAQAFGTPRTKKRAQVEAARQRHTFRHRRAVAWSSWSRSGM